MNNQNLKAAVIDNVIVLMSNHMSPDMLQILEKALIDELADVKLEKLNTLPMDMKDSVDSQNQYIIKLFLILPFLRKKSILLIEL